MCTSALRLPTRAKVALFAAAVLAVSVGCTSRPVLTSTPPDISPIVPTSTATEPPAIPQFILVAPDGADASIAEQAEVALQDLASGAGAEFARLNALPAEAPAAIELLIALPPDPGVQNWAETNPTVRLATLGIPGIQAAESLSVLAPDGFRYDQLGFALGYLAAMVTPEYRLGALALEPSAESLSLARGFVAGGTYYCGLCRPAHPPYEGYPVLFDGPGPQLTSSGVKALLVAPPPTSLSDLGLNATSGLAFLGPGGAFSSEAPSWIASADFDVAGTINALWTQLQAGQTGTVMPLGIRYHTVDAARVSEGRLLLAEAILEDLAAGRIDTGVDPLTGNLR
jgi:hypothetical protein